MNAEAYYFPTIPIVPPSLTICASSTILAVQKILIRMRKEFIICSGTFIHLAGSFQVHDDRLRAKSIMNKTDLDQFVPKLTRRSAVPVVFVISFRKSFLNLKRSDTSIQRSPSNICQWPRFVFTDPLQSIKTSQNLDQHMQKLNQ